MRSEEKGRGCPRRFTEKHVVRFHCDVEYPDAKGKEVYVKKSAKETAESRTHPQSQGRIQDARHDAGVCDEILEEAV